jgi:hypothetical protein
LGACICCARRGCGNDYGGTTGGPGGRLVVAETGKEFIGGVGRWHVEVAAFGVVYVLAVVWCVYGWIAGFDAELAAPEEAVPESAEQ